MGFFQSTKRCLSVFVVFCALLFIAPYIYAHWHFDVINPAELYLMDKHSWEQVNRGETSYMSYQEWHDMQDQRHQDFVEYICNESAYALDPWYEPVKYERDFGREE